MRPSISPSHVPAAPGISPPTVTAVIADIEMWPSEIEVVAVWVAGIDAEMPKASVPIERPIEICGVDVRAILPVEKNITQVEITLCPIDTKEVVVVVDAHQIIEVDLVCCLVLVLGQVELVCHFVGKEQSLFTGLVVTHARCLGDYGK